MKKTLYMKVSHDKYEFPEIVCDSVRQLAEKTGIDARTISAHICRLNKGEIKKARFRAVQYNDWESDEDW